MELGVEEEERKERRGRIIKTIAVIVLLLLLLLIPLRAQRFLWYTRNVRCLRCHPEMIAKFEQAETHRPFKEERCLSCHKEHTTVSQAKETARNRSRWGEKVEAVLPRFITQDLWNLLSPPTQPQVRGVKSSAAGEYLKSGEGELCLSCHQAIASQMGRAYPHPPFNKKECTGCHDPHAADHGALTRERSDELCAICHRMDPEFARALKHRPFEVRSCPSCHTGHASDHRGLLRGAEKDVCFECHQGLAPQLSMPVQHRPFDAGECTGCHEPHSSEAGFLLIEEMPGVCYRCHTKTKEDFAGTSRHPVSASFTCVKCHEPHAGENLVLLPASGNEVCYRCHRDIEPSFEAVDHSKIPFDRGAGACLGCHFYHGSSYKPLLVDESVALCRRCHPDRYTKMSHPVGNDVFDGRRYSTLTCTSTCHWIHYVPKKALLKWERDELCLSCHPGTGYWR
ncbi:MAG: cytochrome c3 family protein [Candidatus Aquicultorales bacterium]